MWLPKSKAKAYKTCGGECATSIREADKRARDRQCKTCGAVFCPRPAQLKVGGGLYCCTGCASEVLSSGRTPQARAKAAETRKRSLASGLFVIPVGPDHPSWMGGPEAEKHRRKAKPKKPCTNNKARAASTRAWRRKNPDIANPTWTKGCAKKAPHGCREAASTGSGVRSDGSAQYAKKTWSGQATT